jgi:hypothetical protein
MSPRRRGWPAFAGHDVVERAGGAFPARSANQASLLTSPAEVGGVNGLVCDVEVAGVLAVLAVPPAGVKGLGNDCCADADDVAPDAPEQELMGSLSVVGGRIEGRGYRLVGAVGRADAR